MSTRVGPSTDASEAFEAFSRLQEEDLVEDFSFTSFESAEAQLAAGAIHRQMRRSQELFRHLFKTRGPKEGAGDGGDGAETGQEEEAGADAQDEDRNRGDGLAEVAAETERGEAEEDMDQGDGVAEVAAETGGGGGDEAKEDAAAEEEDRGDVVAENAAETRQAVGATEDATGEDTSDATAKEEVGGGGGRDGDGTRGGGDGGGDVEGMAETSVKVESNDETTEENVDACFHSPTIDVFDHPDAVPEEVVVSTNPDDLCPPDTPDHADPADPDRPTIKRLSAGPFQYVGIFSPSQRRSWLEWVVADIDPVDIDGSTRVTAPPRHPPREDPELRRLTRRTAARRATTPPQSKPLRDLQSSKVTSSKPSASSPLPKTVVVPEASSVLHVCRGKDCCRPKELVGQQQRAVTPGRSCFSEHQLHQMQRSFDEKIRPSDLEIKMLAARISLRADKVKSWFRRRRSQQRGESRYYSALQNARLQQRRREAAEVTPADDDGRTTRSGRRFGGESAKDASKFGSCSVVNADHSYAMGPHLWPRN